MLAGSKEKLGDRLMPGSGNAQAVVDLVHLAHFTMNDDALAAEVLELFVANAPKYLSQMRDAHSADDWRLAAHTLKGSARAIGAWKVACAAEAAECMANDCGGQMCQSVLIELDGTLAETIQFIENIT